MSFQTRCKSTNYFINLQAYLKKNFRDENRALFPLADFKNFDYFCLVKQNTAVKYRLTLLLLFVSALHCAAQIDMELYRYYQGRQHQSDDMVQFVLSDYDRATIRNLAESFDSLDSVISFVQSLRYVSDLDSKGEEEYVRFPIETLVDGEGDCEDLAILAAAILHEMGYKVLLVLLPDHLALAVDCNDTIDGTYYNYQGTNYYFLEVTHPGWKIGQIPNEFSNSQAKLVPLAYRPRIRLRKGSYLHESYHSSDNEVPFVVSCELENSGPGTTTGLSVHVTFKTHGGFPMVDRVFRLPELSEGESATYDLNVSLPRPFKGELEIKTEGSNFNEESVTFDNIHLK